MTNSGTKPAGAASNCMASTGRASAVPHLLRAAKACGLAEAAVLSLSVTSCVADSSDTAPRSEDTDRTEQAATTEGYWECVRGDWSAGTRTRSMESDTFFECGHFGCPDTSHSQPTTWVDIVGGISDSCDDHSTSFFGPLGGEWNGCTASYPENGGPPQTSTGWGRIEGVNQYWDRWPWTWRSGRYSGCDLSYALTTDSIYDAFATVYDLDTCIDKQLIGTIRWGNVPVTGYLAGGSPLPSSCTDTNGTGWFRVWLNGEAPVACSGIENACASDVCADLWVAAEFSCTWVPPRECRGVGEYCSAYHNPNDTSCCTGFCYNFQCR